MKKKKKKQDNEEVQNSELIMTILTNQKKNKLENLRLFTVVSIF